MASTKNIYELFSYYSKYLWRAVDFENFQSTLLLYSEALASGNRSAVVRGHTFNGAVGFDIDVDPGLSLSPNDFPLHTSAITTGITVGPPSPTEGRWTLIVARKTEQTINTITDPTNPTATVDLNIEQQTEIVAIDGTIGPSPSYPAKLAGDTILFGLKLPALAGSVIASYVDYSITERPDYYLNELTSRTLIIENSLQRPYEEDSVSTGANATLEEKGKTTVILTDASLTSIDMIPAGGDGEQLTLVNETGNTITINNLTGATASQQIITGTGANHSFLDKASITLFYDALNTKWRMFVVPEAGEITQPTQQIFTSSGTWNRPAGCTRIKVTVQGGGGAGGGNRATGAGQFAGGSGGGGGGCAIAWIDVTALASQALTVGAGGAGNSGDAGNGGNSSVFGSLAGNGGGGGSFSTASVNNSTTSTGGAGGTATGGDFNIPGSSGTVGFHNGSVGLSGKGGESHLGNGGGSKGSISPREIGEAGRNYGGGGAGNIAGPNRSAAAGGAGAAGIIIVEEFYD